MASALPPAGRRLLQVDGLRGIAAAAVVLFHFTTRFDELFVHTEPLALSFSYGHLGVQLFFVISGFVIFMTLERAKAPMDFVVSRFSRLFPTYWTAVIVTASLLALLALPGFQPTSSQVIANFSMVQELFLIDSIDGVYWSLEIELIFYVWMLALWVAGGLRAPVLLFATWLVVATGAQLAVRHAGLPIPHGISHVLLFKWIPWFALGIAAYLMYRQPDRLARKHLVLAGLAITAIAIAGGGLGLSALALACFVAVALGSRGRIAILNWRPLVWLGAISYPLYLLHDKIGWVTMRHLEAQSVSPALAVAAALAMSVAAAFVVHLLVEKPMTRWLRDRYRRRRQRRANDAGATRSGAAARWQWGAACGLALCIAMSGGMIGRLMKGQPPAPPAVAINGWSDGDNASPDACARLRLRGSPLIVVLGQSNAASHGQPDGAYPPTWVYHDGKCGERRDPLPGTTGSGASIWPRLAQQIRLRAADGEPVVFAPAAVGGTRIAHWTRPGPLNSLLQAHLAEVAASGFRIKAILWQHGEADMLAGTPAEDYVAALEVLDATIRRHGIDAPLYIARSTYCRQLGAGAIRRGVERYLQANADTRLRAGADTDQLVGEQRVDGCHFSASGLAEAGALWADALGVLPLHQARRHD